MFSQADIDAVLNNAQEAVDSLAREADAVTGGLGAHHGAARSPVPVATPVAAPPPPGRPGPATRSAAESARHIDRILKLRVPVVVRLASRMMRTADVLKLAPGSIVEFERTVSDELDLMVNNRQIGTGEAVKVGEHFGLRVAFLGDVKQRLASIRGG